jgi:hypothetical protein
LYKLPAEPSGTPAGVMTSGGLIVKLTGAEVRPPPAMQAGEDPVESVTGTTPALAISAAVMVVSALVPPALTAAKRGTPLKLTEDVLVQKFVPVKVKVNGLGAPAVCAGGFNAVITGLWAIAGIETPAAHIATVVKNRGMDRFTFGPPDSAG